MPDGLEGRERRVVAFLERYWLKFGYAPSYEEIRQGGHLSSKDQVFHILQRLEGKGYINRKPGMARSIKLLRTVTGEVLEPWDMGKSRFVHVPLLGKIACGEPIHWPASGSDPYDHEIIELTGSLVGNRQQAYALKVEGDSMIEAMISDGDTVVLEPYSGLPANGDIVAVWLPGNEETTLKKFYREGDMARLQPCNSQMAPIFMPLSAVQVQGRLIAVIRQLH